MSTEELCTQLIPVLEAVQLQTGKSLAACQNLDYCSVLASVSSLSSLVNLLSFIDFNDNPYLKHFQVRINFIPY